MNLVTARTDVEKLRRCGLIVADMLDKLCAEVKVARKVV